MAIVDELITIIGLKVDPKNVKSTLKAYTGKVYLNVQDSESEFKENVIDAEENYDY